DRTPQHSYLALVPTGVCTTPSQTFAALATYPQSIQSGSSPRPSASSIMYRPHASAPFLLHSHVAGLFTRCGPVPNDVVESLRGSYIFQPLTRNLMSVGSPFSQVS